MGKNEDSLQFLLDLNSQIAEDEEAAKPVVGPGLPSVVTNRKAFVTKDCLKP
jgi:hypothetical protein